MEYVLAGLGILAFGYFLYRRLTRKEVVNPTGGVGGGQPDDGVKTDKK